MSHVDIDFNNPHVHLIVGDRITRQLQGVIGFTHHGIVVEVGDGTLDTVKVVHFTGEKKNQAHAKIEETTFRVFLNNCSWYRVLHHLKNAGDRTPEEAAKFARSLVGRGEGEYEPTGKNCEWFVNFCYNCKTGKSLQVQRLIRTAVAFGAMWSSPKTVMTVLEVKYKALEARAGNDEEKKKELEKNAICDLFDQILMPVAFTQYYNSN